MLIVLLLSWILALITMEISLVIECFTWGLNHYFSLAFGCHMQNTSCCSVVLYWKLFGFCRLAFIQLALQIGHTMLLFSTREIYQPFALVISCGGEPQMLCLTRCGKERNCQMNYLVCICSVSQ
jgi:hypothetical protein